MKKALLLLLLIIGCRTYSQAPFTTLSMEPVHIKEVADDNTEKKTFMMASKDDEGAKTTEPDKDVDFFKNNSLALSIINGAENRASVSSQVLFYKINFLTPIDKDSAKFRYNVPLMIISKLSTTYDTINMSSALDVLDYEAAPVTLRIMPSFKISNNDTYKERLLMGFYADARGLNLYNPETNDYSMEIVGSGGVGFTFDGEGEAGIYNSNGEYESGRWSLSAILQGAIGDKKVIQKMFDTEKDYVTSFQAYFSFKVKENSSFNLKIGYHHLFQQTVSGSNNNFSIALGI